MYCASRISPVWLSAVCCSYYRVSGMIHQEHSRRGSLILERSTSVRLCPVSGSVHSSILFRSTSSAQFCKVLPILFTSAEYVQFCPIFWFPLLSTSDHFYAILHNFQFPVLPSSVQSSPAHLSPLMPDSVRFCPLSSNETGPTKSSEKAWTGYLTPLLLSAALWCRCRAVWWGIQSIADEDITECVRIILPRI